VGGETGSADCCGAGESSAEVRMGGSEVVVLLGWDAASGGGVLTRPDAVLSGGETQRSDWASCVARWEDTASAAGSWCSMVGSPQGISAGGARLDAVPPGSGVRRGLDGTST